MTSRRLSESQHRGPEVAHALSSDHTSGDMSAHSRLLTPANVDLEKRVSAFLSSQGRFSLKRIKVAASDGVVTLKGCVRSFYEKQLCLGCVKHVAGVTRLIDVIEVDSKPVVMET